MTPFDLPLQTLASVAPGSSENVAYVSAILALMKESFDGEYSPSPGSEPVPSTIRLVEAKFGADGPVARLVRKVLS